MNTSKYKMNHSVIATKTGMRILFLFVLSIAAFVVPKQYAAAQQQYPVKIQPAVSFPSTFLSDYGDPSTTSIRVYLADLTKQNYTINIRMKLTDISSKKVSYENKTGINITLNGGDVYFLNSDELRRLFALNNIAVTVSGQINEANVLPEGTYSLVIEAYDANSNVNVAVSNPLTDFAIFNVVRYDPPLLNTPVNKQEFDLQTTNQNIFFNWTPRHIAYASQQIQYRYRMIRVIPVDRNPYDAMNVSVANKTGNIDVNALDFATFIYSPTDLALIPGSVYAWQVQAYEMVNGVVSTSRFKNQGLSEVFTFSVKEHCGQITLLQPVITANAITFSWNGDTDSEYNEYEFNYRKAGSYAAWTPISTIQNSLVLDNTVLQPGIAYEYNVRARCNNWLLPVQGSTVTLAAPTCVAPSPLTVSTNTGSTLLSWTAVTGPDSLQVSYKVTGSADDFTTKTVYVTDIQYALPLLTSGSYTVRLDAFCGAETARGKQDTIYYNENGVVGPCPIPLPFELIATRVKDDVANLKWNSTSVHTGSGIVYWHKDSSTVTYPYQQVNAATGVNGIHIYNDQVYAYQIDYLCGNKHKVTPVGMFRILSSAAQVSIDPPTASCFPPVDIRAEARDSVTARVEWDKITGADSYELSYRVKGSNTPFTTFNTTATNTTLKPLQEGAQYQLLVRVKCSGAFSIYSDTAVVNLSQGRNRNCDTVTFVKALNKTTTNIQLAWNFDQTCTGYIIKFRESEQSLANEYTQAFTNIDSLKNKNVVLDTVRYTFQNLKSGTKYIFRIQKICGQNNAVFNLPVTASTLPDIKSSGACGGGNVCDKNPAKSLKSLAVGDTIYCADYQVVIDSVTPPANSSAGIYSGLGHMEMPVPGLGDFVNMHVSFKNVKINDKPNSCVYDGTINIDSMNASIIPTAIRDSVKALMAKAEGLIDEANAALAEVQGAIDEAQKALQQGIDYFQGGDGVGSVKTGELGDKLIDTNIPVPPPSAAINGNTVTIAGGSTTVDAFPALLKDNTGKVFQVTATGTVTYVGVYDTAFAKDPEIDLSAQIVTYTEANGATFDFDAYKEIYKPALQITREYEKLSDTYYVPAKFIIPGALDKVTATLSGGSADPAKVVFSNGKGFVYDKAGQTGRTLTLNLAGGPASDGQYIYAWYVDGTTKKAIGKLLLPSYEPKTKKVVLVPVKGKRVYDPAIYQTYLNDTYKKIGITYEVTVDNSFRTNKAWDLNGDTLVQTAHSGLLSNDYQGEEAAMVQAYADFVGEDNIDPDAAYFMAVYEESGIEDNGVKLLGKMPAEEQFGFLYAGGVAMNATGDDALKRTMAHELGHGAYHLEHTFTTLYLGIKSKESTYNLMDYKNGNELWKYQWDIVHDPGHVWGILKRDKDALAVAVKEKPGVISGYVISASDANIRSDNSPYEILQPKQLLQKGSEIEMVTLSLSTSYNNICKVKNITDLKNYNTSISNVTKIIKLDKIENYKVKVVVKPSILPFSNILAGNSLAKGTMVKVNRVCGIYSQIKDNTTTNQGWWVETSSLTRMPNDVSDNFDWMTKATIIGNSVSTETLNTIIKNREGINDRSNGEIYSFADKLKTYTNPKTKKVGTYYDGKNLAVPTIKGSTDFETAKLKLIYTELNVEGGFSSINTWDDEVFTWGKGLAAKGGKISIVISNLFLVKNKNYEQIFANVGIRITNNNLSVLTEDGTWKTDNLSSKSTLYASMYIESNKKLLSFFMEIAEKADYSTDVTTQMWATISEGIGKIPSYVFSTDKTAYSENWNDESITVLSHLSHWLPGQSWSTIDYSSTKGKLENILYNFIYNTVRTNSQVRAKTLITNIFVWGSTYKIIEKLEDFGTPNKGAGIEKVEEKWNNHEIAIIFKIDKKNVERVFKDTDTDTEFITNSNVVIISRGVNYLILTKDQGILTFKLDE